MTVRAAADLIQPGLLGEAVDTGPALVFVADDDGRLVAVNRRACEVLGYEREELLDLRVSDVATAPEAPDLYTELKRAGAAAGTTLLRAKDGTLRPFAYRAAETTTAGMPFWVSVGFVDD
jgi:PAS domain S-box-containing protein